MQDGWRRGSCGSPQPTLPILFTPALPGWCRRLQRSAPAPVPRCTYKEGLSWHLMVLPAWALSDVHWQNLVVYILGQARRGREQQQGRAHGNGHLAAGHSGILPASATARAGSTICQEWLVNSACVDLFFALRCVAACNIQALHGEWYHTQVGNRNAFTSATGSLPQGQARDAYQLSWGCMPLDSLMPSSMVAFTVGD